MCCSQHLNETVAWGVSGTRLQEWIPGVGSFKTSLKIMKPFRTTHWQRCLTLTPTEESLTVIPSQKASASKRSVMGEQILIAGKIPKLHDWSNSFVKARTWQYCELASSTSEVLENHKCPAIWEAYHLVAQLKKPLIRPRFQSVPMGNPFFKCFVSI